MNISIARLQKKIDALKEGAQKELQVLEAQLLDKKRKSLIVCQRCRKRSPVYSWIFIQGFRHAPPTGYRGGDYWNRSKVEDCHIVCHKCGNENRIFTHPQKDKILTITGGVHDKLELFAEVEERYEDN